MVKIVRFFCIIGIAGLLALFIGYTELENNKEAEKKISEIEKKEQLDEESLKVEVDETKTSLSFKIISLL